ncbi:class I adenylate-forming enzyme family protein [Nocardia sp. NBC_01388]|uniref:class I adenylate-forming enzyme family protein n=1 Tax=Nocardia sp. NBC_01388 TaxID=2903596 RepID=UPI00324F0213
MSEDDIVPTTWGEERVRLDEWESSTIGRLLLESAARQPDRAALQWLEDGQLQSLTWHRLARLALAGAARLRSGSETRFPIAVMSDNSMSWYVLFWSAALSGRPLVPINPNLTAGEVRALLIDSGPVTVLASDVHGRHLIGRVREAGRDLIAADQVVEIAEWVSSLGEAADAIVGETSLPFAVEPADTLVVQFTSGTTGEPKGVVLSHQACLNAARTLAARTSSAEHEIWCSPMPLHHVGGSVALALGTATLAGTYVMVTDFSALNFLESAVQSNATFIGGVPTLFLRMMEDPELARMKPPNLRAILLGASAVPATLIRRIEKHFGAPVLVMYGQSEAPAITETSREDDLWTKSNTVGRVLPHRELRVVNTQTGLPCVLDEVGEICVRTKVRMDGYLNRPEETAATVDSEGWIHTGDLGALDRENRLHFHGRLKDLIVRGGENISAREVELAIEAHPDVAMAAVVGLPDPTWGEVVAAMVVLNPGCTLRLEELREPVSAGLAPFKRPVHWRIADALPLTASGKPQKFKIIELLRAEI